MSYAASDPDSPVVVIVEDDALIRFLAGEALAEAGFGVVEASGADEALEILKDHAREIQAMFTDIDMPGSMDGVALARRTRCRWPWIALIVTSGKALPDPRAMPAGSRFIPKPYQAGYVLDQIRDMVAHNRALGALGPAPLR